MCAKFGVFNLKTVSVYLNAETDRYGKRFKQIRINAEKDRDREKFKQIRYERWTNHENKRWKRNWSEGKHVFMCNWLKFFILKDSSCFLQNLSIHTKGDIRRETKEAYIDKVQKKIGF